MNLVKLCSVVSACFVFGCGTGDGVEGAQTGEACAANDLLAQCPPNTVGMLEATADSSCSMDGSVDIDNIAGTGSGAVSQVCVGTGSCRVACELVSPCEFGVESVSEIDGIVCSDAPCGNGVCEAGETPGNCGVDCREGGCGDGMCDPGETPNNCSVDCGGIDCENFCNAIYATCFANSPTYCPSPNRTAFDALCGRACQNPNLVNYIEVFNMNLDCDVAKLSGLIPLEEDFEARCLACNASGALCVVAPNGDAGIETCMDYEWRPQRCLDGQSCVDPGTDTIDTGAAICQ